MAQKSGLIRHLYGPQGIELVVGKLDTLGKSGGLDNPFARIVNTTESKPMPRKAKIPVTV
jgi:hypothetical protein